MNADNSSYFLSRVDSLNAIVLSKVNKSQVLRHGERGSWHFFFFCYKYSRKGDASLPPTGHLIVAGLQVMVALVWTHRAPAESPLPSSGRYLQRTERRTEALWNQSHSCGQAERGDQRMPVEFAMEND